MLDRDVLTKRRGGLLWFETYQVADHDFALADGASGARGGLGSSVGALLLLDTTGRSGRSCALGSARAASRATAGSHRATLRGEDLIERLIELSGRHSDGLRQGDDSMENGSKGSS